MPDKIRMIALGVGGVSRGMLSALRDKSWHELVAAVDVSDEALARTAAENNLPRSALYTDLAAALDEVAADVVMINTPSELHALGAEAVLRAGLTPLVAKPMCNDFNDAVALTRLAAEKGVKLGVAQQMRYRRHYLSVAEFVSTGALGEIEQIYFLSAKPRHQPRNLEHFAQPVLWDMSCHHLDSLYSILPQLIPQAVICDGFRPSWTVYDSDCMINGLLRFQGGARMLYHAGYSTQASCYELRLEGALGALRCRGIHMSNDTMAYEFAERGADFAPIDLEKGRPPSQPWSLFFDQWHDWLNGGGERHFSGSRNLKVLATIDAAIESLSRGAFVQVAGNPRYQAAFEASA
ncbi:MAG: Gfo/Idh/MocA family oxidoreductase [Chloroflexota bacterium]|nr:Gfo/Idh/MocA family oxidoreductase [Chloroflexota bacterium]